MAYFRKLAKTLADRMYEVNLTLTQKNVKFYAFLLGLLIGYFVFISFIAWIVTLAFPITFFQAFLILLGLETIVKAIKGNSK